MASYRNLIITTDSADEPYLLDLGRRIWNFFKKCKKEIKNLLSHYKKYARSWFTSRSNFQDFAVSFFAASIGFLFMGGLGDGGIIDMDIAAFGIGGHRSIFFHSILIGFLVEFSLCSLLELVKIIYSKLPEDHHRAWDRLLELSHRATNYATAGAYAGLATHLTIDSHFGGWTPYKDLPLQAPQWAHHLTMDINAVTSGVMVWQWRKLKWKVAGPRRIVNHMRWRTVRIKHWLKETFT